MGTGRAHGLQKLLLIRNVARQTVSTHFVLPSDIKLYPRCKRAENGQFLLLFQNLIHKIVFQPKPHLKLSGYDSKKWPPATKNKVNRFNINADCLNIVLNYSLRAFSPRVFVNNVFEIEANHSLPETKSELVK